MSLWGDIGSFLHNTVGHVFGGGMPAPSQPAVQAQVQRPQPGPQAQVQQPQAQQPPAGWSVGRVVHDITHNPVTNFGGDIAKPLLRTGMAVNQGIGNAELAIAGRPTQNAQQFFGNANYGPNKLTGYTGQKRQVAGDLLNTAVTAVTPGIGKGIGAGIEKVGGTVLPTVIKKAATGALTGAVTGGPYNVSSLVASKTPITKKNLTAAYKQGTIGGAALGGIGEGAVPAAKLAKNLGLVRPTPLNDAELNASTKIMQAQQGLIDKRNVTSQDSALFHNAQVRLGANPGTPEGMDAVNKALLAHHSFDVQLQQRQQALKAAGQKVQAFTQDHPIGLGVRAVDEEGRPVSAFGAPRAKLTGKALDIPNKQLASPEQVGNALGMSPEQVRAAGRPPQLGPRPKVTPLQADAEKQAALGSGAQPSAAENTAKNPVKVNIPEVQPGDYEKARSNAQLASNPVDFATGQAYKAVKALSKDDKAKFWKAVEDPAQKMSPQLKEAVSRWNDLSNRAHATSQSLGGNTNYIQNYARHNWDLSNPEDAAKMQQIINARGGAAADPYSFGGIDRMPRVFKSVKEGEAAGFHLKNADPAQDILEYGKGVATNLRKQALTKGMTEADMNEPLKNRAFDLGNGQTISLSDKGINELRGFKQADQTGTLVKGYRAVNRKAKQTLLSASEFHPINVAALKAAPALAAEGHPVLAAKGLYGTFRAQVGRGYSDALQQSALKDGTVENGARIGTPIKFGSDYESDGKLNLGKAGVGERTIFEKAMPAMHIRMVQGIVKDLQAKGIPLDSPEARAAGTRVNEIMGFVNTELRNLDKGHQRALGDIALAPQFTRSKWATIKSALTEKGLGGSYARRAMVANVATDTALALGIGYLAKQKSDDVKDILLRSIFHPSVPTPWKDAKGNTVELGLPASYTSEVLGLGATLQRGADGHLHVKWNPGNIPGNVANYGRSRLSVIPSTALKVATNTDFANKPLYDPNAPFGTKAEQAATTVGTGLLPIGLQGVAQTSAVKSRLPQPVQQVLNANAPGSNALVKSVGSAFGLTPRTDTTVGKGLQTSQYFDALNTAKQGLNRQEQDTLDLYSGSKKNPVTGKYDINPTVFDAPAKATNLLQSPKVIDNLIQMNKTLQSKGQKVDPLWLQPKDKIVKYLQYQTMPPGGPDAADWRNKNPWYNKDANSLYTQRNSFFNSLPPGDPNKPKAPIEYPQPDGQTLKDTNVYYATANPAQRAQFLRAHADVSAYMDNQAAYTNAVRVARGYGALRNYPTPSPYVQAKLDSMSGMTGRQRAMVYADPQVAAWSQQDAVYNLTKGAGLAQIQGNSPTSKMLGASASLGYSIMKNPDGTYALKYPDTQGGSSATAIQAGARAVSGGSSGGSSNKAYHVNIQPLRKPYIQAHKPFGENRVHIQNWNNRIKFVKSPTSTKIKVGTMSSSKTIKPAQAALHKA